MHAGSPVARDPHPSQDRTGSAMTSTATCPSCRKGVFPDDVFCSWCGSRILRSASPQRETDRTRAHGMAPTGERSACHSCNGPILPGDVFCSACGAQVGATAVMGGESGTRIAREIGAADGGKYEIVRELGRGGMGMVFLARDRELHRRVAIKVLSPALLTDEDMVRRFLREARIIASLRHESIVSIYEVGQAGDLRYFVMDYIDGVSLSQVLRSRGPLPVPIVETVLYQVGQALAYVHRSGQGLVHRDVKPSNVMLDPEGIAVLMDFGISKVDESGGGITRTGLVIGTPEYMSPEQCRGLVTTPESDQYALGAVAYALLTGRPPFTGPFYQVLVAHQAESPTAIQELRPDCPPALAAAVERMLSKSPGDRWPTIPEALRSVGLRPLLPDDPLRQVLGRLVVETKKVAERPKSGGGAGSASGAGSAGSTSGSTAGSTAGSTSGSTGGTQPTRIRIDPPPAELLLGEPLSLGATLVFENGEPAPGSSLSWHSTDPEVIRVDPSTGEMVAVGVGKATVFVVGAGLAESVTLEVRAPTVHTIRVQPELSSMEVGEHRRFVAELLSASGAPVEGPVEWVSSDPGVVRLAPDGTALARGEGTVRLLARCQGREGMALVRVEAPALQAAAGAPPTPTPSVPVPPEPAPWAPAPSTAPTSAPAPSPAPTGGPSLVGAPGVEGTPSTPVAAGGGGSPGWTDPRRLALWGLPGLMVLVVVLWLAGRPGGGGGEGAGSADRAAVGVPAGAAAALEGPAGGTPPGEPGAVPGESSPTDVDAPPVTGAGAGTPGAPGDSPATAAAQPATPTQAPAATQAPATQGPATQAPTPQAPPAAAAPPPRTEPAPAPARGRLEINIRPWADVFVDGVARGQFQTRVELDVAAGRRRIRLENPNLQPVDTTVVVEAGRTTVVNRALLPRSEP